MKKFFFTNKNIKLISKKTIKLKKIEINQICKLKMENWGYSLGNQLSWFKKNILKNDLHNLIIKDNKIIGYTCLRKRNFLLENNSKNFLLFDTLVIKKKYQKKNLGNILMNFNNKIIKKNKISSYLLTSRSKILFYKKNKWKIKTNNYLFASKKLNNKILMYFNSKIINKEIFFNV